MKVGSMEGKNDEETMANRYQSTGIGMVRW